MLPYRGKEASEREKGSIGTGERKRRNGGKKASEWREEGVGAEVRIFDCDQKFISE